MFMIVVESSQISSGSTKRSACVFFTNSKYVLPTSRIPIASSTPKAQGAPAGAFQKSDNREAGSLFVRDVQPSVHP